MREYAAREINGGKPLLADPLFQSRLSDIEIELMALEFTELQQAVQSLAMDVAAYYQGVLPNDLAAEQLGHAFGSKARQAYMYGRAATIYGGSNEVQKNIIAKAVLGL